MVSLKSVSLAVDDSFFQVYKSMEIWMSEFTRLLEKSARVSPLVKEDVNFYDIENQSPCPYWTRLFDRILKLVSKVIVAFSWWWIMLLFLKSNAIETHSYFVGTCCKVLSGKRSLLENDGLHLCGVKLEQWILTSNHNYKVSQINWTITITLY